MVLGVLSTCQPEKGVLVAQANENDVTAMDHMLRATSLLAAVTNWINKGTNKEEALALLDTVSNHVDLAKETLSK